MSSLRQMPDGSFVARFDRNVYRLAAVKKAAYKYGDRFHVLIEGTDDFVSVSLRPMSSNSDPEVAVGSFCNEVLDQELREEIAAETNGIRDLLLDRFIKLDDSRYVLTNFAGEYIVTDRDNLVRFVKKDLPPDSDLYAQLKSRHFLNDAANSVALNLLATKYRTKQQPLSEFTGLHMFVPTLRCNNSCSYCQVSRKSSTAEGCDMTQAVAERGIEFMFNSPSTVLKLEFQGGEPLLNFDIVRYIVERTRELCRTNGRIVNIVICSNLASIC